ncbi:forkhead-associated domain-containing protein 1-like isoform X2 [Littorina saxatilis]|uniref:FHA domain-containing protein n=1 Tax=Littorina saxatilis TaxID=31220 RepID=A0AAN9G3J8_9CAEN
MKAFLKGQDGSFFNLAPKVTTVGREGCDLTIQVQGVDYQHAVVEYCEQEDCLVLQDLNTAQGTYVNDVRVQNAAVRLAPGDRIRFGYNGSPYELQIEQTSTGMTCPPVHQRQAWSGSLTVLNETPVYSNANTQHAMQQSQQNVHSQHLLQQQQQQLQQQQQQQQQIYQQQQQAVAAAQGLPFLPPTQFSPTAWTQPIPQAPIPRPPLRSRPLSAGAARRSTFDVPRFQPISTTVGAPVSRPTPVGGWMNGGQRGGMSGPQAADPAPALDLAQQQARQQLQEKEQQLGQLTEEVTRLRSYEFESYRKDQLIQQLQQQIGDLQLKLREEPSVIMGTGDGESSQRLSQLEIEVETKKAEVNALRDQLTQVQTQGSGSPLMLRQELGERMKEVATLRGELERVKKDKNITSGLVTQMQRDMSNKDSTISKLTREIEVLKKDMRERDKLLANANIKVNKIREASSTSKVAEERDAREKELISLRQRFKGAESKISEQFNVLTSLRDEVETMKNSLLEEKDARRKLQAEADSSRSQFLDIQRAERVVRVDLEQAQRSLERFRNRIVQTVFATPGVKAPEKEINDDELVEELKKLLEERTELAGKIKSLESDVKDAASGTEKLKDEGEKLREALQESVDRLKESGRLSTSLKQELSVVQSLSSDSALLWIRDMIADVFSADLEWQNGIDAALLKCGVNSKLSTEAPGNHIERLYVKWESALSEEKRLQAQIAELESYHLQELKMRLDAQNKELQEKMLDAVETARLEGEEKVNRAIDGIKALEEEKLQNAVSEEKRRVQELETNIDQLRLSLMQRQDEDKAKLEQASELVSQVEQYKQMEMELKDSLAKLEERMRTEVTQLSEEKDELKTKMEENVESYKEQVRQHSVTICSMEERLAKLTKRNKDYHDEMSSLKKSNSGLKAELDKRIVQKPAVPPKPKVILQRPTEEINALEHVVSLLRQENVELKKSVTEQQDVIMGLRRDLSGASARLSDISGEMSESQKREMEKNRELLGRRDTEMTELRQQMAKLSKIIDKQKDEVKTLQEELGKEKSLAMKYHSDLQNKSACLNDLESRLVDEKEEQKKQLDMLDQEGRITSELVGIGAQCRGERHDQIIMRQREALAELRSRVKNLEQARPPLPTQDQALQQVVMLKKELAEMRANQALAEDKIIASKTSLDREVGRARGLITPTNTEADMERSAHRETMDTLERSEQTFLTLLRAMANAMELEDVPGLRAMAHLPRDERQNLVLEREAACEFIASRIQVLQERISRKDELLQGYENDLGKLRQSQEIAEKKASQIDQLSHDVRSRAEESQYLRESLNRTRDRLNQEKRLNTAIKQKKTFHLENERAHLRPQSAGRTTGKPNQEQQPAAPERKKVQREVMKRKNYEIKTLKEELCDKEQALYDREKRLMSLETTLGLERPIEVLE